LPPPGKIKFTYLEKMGTRYTHQIKNETKEGTLNERERKNCAEKGP